MTSESIEIRSQRADTQIPNFLFLWERFTVRSPHYGARSLELLPEREGGKVLISLTLWEGFRVRAYGRVDPS
jgi:hypothetical protein